MEIRCVGCDAILRVGDEHQNRQVRCPGCGHIQTVGEVVAPPASSPLDSVYGELPAQAGQTPVLPDDPASVSTGPIGMGEEVGSGMSSIEGTGQDETIRSAPPTNDIRADFQRANQKSHRSVLIITIAILGMGCTCPALSILAWVMSSNDLRRMSSGEMDPAGRDVTRVGYYIGMGASILWISLSLVITLALLIRGGA